MAKSIDGFEQDLQDPTKNNLLLVLGLADIKPKDPYKNLGHTSGKLAQAFLCAVIIDRILWALSINILEPFIRYINDDFPTEFEDLDIAHFMEPMYDVAASLAACEDRVVEYSDSLTGDNLRCGVATIRHRSLGRFHNVASQLYYTASLIFFLGAVGEMYHIPLAPANISLTATRISK
jgi:hypothetical protein